MRASRLIRHDHHVLPGELAESREAVVRLIKENAELRNRIAAVALENLKLSLRLERRVGDGQHPERRVLAG